MKKTIFLILVSITLLAMAGCDVLVDKDIRNQKVNILAPADSAILSSTGVLFWWDSLGGATNYNIQIVSPSFTNIQYLVADSIVGGNKFFYSFQPGNYEWRIKGINHSTASDYILRSFSIDSSLNLGGEVVQLISPRAGFMTRDFTIQFQWAPVFYANDYRFEILGPTGNLLHVDAAITTNTTSYTFADDGRYSWRVRAQNNNSVSQYSQGSFLIDVTPPAPPVILSPADGAVITNPFTLNWTQVSDNGSVIYDSLFLFLNSTEDTVIKAIRPIINSYTDSLESRNYYWKLKAVDSLGNSSPYTPLRKFTLQ